MSSQAPAGANVGRALDLANESPRIDALTLTVILPLHPDSRSYFLCQILSVAIDYTLIAH